MRHNESPAVRSILLFLVPLAVYAQSDTVLSQGRALFRGNCAFCHGLTARGGRGPNLVSAPLHHGDTDADLKAVVRNGVSGTPMPAFGDLAGDDIDALILYLRSLAHGVERSKSVSGDARIGRTVYVKSGCPGCHRVAGEGSVFGPDLSRVGAARPVEYLRDSIVNPSADIQPEWEGVTVVTREGKRITGVRLNEDTFTLQLRSLSQAFASFEKQDLRSVVYERKSMMPAYEGMAPVDLENLLAYLATLAGPPRGGAAKDLEVVR